MGDRLSELILSLNEVSISMLAFTDRVEDAEKGRNQLEAISSTLKDSASGLTLIGARVVGLSTESIYKRIGISPPPTPALEAFESYSNRKKATNIAMESASEMAQKVWIAIVNSFAAAIRWIKDFFSRLYSAATGLAEKIKSTLSKTKEKTGELKQTTLKVKPSSKRLVVAKEDMESNNEAAVSHTCVGTLFDTKTDTPTLIRELHNLKKITSVDLPKIFSMIGVYLDIGTKAFNDFKSKDSLNGITFPALQEHLAVKKVTEDKGLTRFASEGLPGGKVLVVYANKNQANLHGADAVSGILQNSITVESLSAITDQKLDRIPVLSKDNAISLLELAIDISVDVNKAEELSKKLDGQFDKFNTSLKVFQSDLKHREFEDGDKIALSHLKTLAATFITLGTRSTPSILSHTVKVTKALLDYCEISLSCYE